MWLLFFVVLIFKPRTVEWKQWFWFLVLLAD